MKSLCGFPGRSVISALAYLKSGNVVEFGVWGYKNHHRVKHKIIKRFSKSDARLIRGSIILTERGYVEEVQSLQLHCRAFKLTEKGKALIDKLYLLGKL